MQNRTIVEYALHDAREPIGVAAEVVDLRSIRPLEERAIYDSVRKTNHTLELAVQPSVEKIIAAAKRACYLEVGANRTARGRAIGCTAP